MTADQFFLKYNNIGLDFDGYYGFQCMDLYQQYNKDVVYGPHIPSPAAADVWNNYPKDLYERIEIKEDNFPQKGDVVIWKKAPNLMFGHIAVAYSGNTTSFVSFDQNWPTGTICHFQNHNYTNVQGWLRPKASIAPTNPQPMLNDQTKIPANFLGWETDLEIQQIRGLLGDLKKTLKQLEECQNKPVETPETGDYTASQLFAMFLKKAFS